MQALIKMHAGLNTWSIFQCNASVVQSTGELLWENMFTLSVRVNNLYPCNVTQCSSMCEWASLREHVNIWYLPDSFDTHDLRWLFCLAKFIWWSFRSWDGSHWRGPYSHGWTVPTLSHCMKPNELSCGLGRAMYMQKKGHFVFIRWIYHCSPQAFYREKYASQLTNRAACPSAQNNCI